MLFVTIHSHSWPQDSDMAPISEGWFPPNWESLVYSISKEDYSLRMEIFYSINSLVFLLPSLSPSQMLHFPLVLCGFLSICFQTSRWHPRDQCYGKPSFYLSMGPTTGVKSYQLIFNLVLPINSLLGTFNTHTIHLLVSCIGIYFVYYLLWILRVVAKIMSVIWA